MNHGNEETEARLERLRLATEAIVPRGDFAARVAANIARQAASAPGDWLGELLRPAWRLIPIAAIAAAVALVCAARSERAWHDAYDTRIAANAEGFDTEW